MPLYKDKEKRIFDGEEWKREIVAIDCALCGKRIFDYPKGEKITYEFIETLCRTIDGKKSYYNTEFLCFDCACTVDLWYDEYLKLFDKKMCKWISELDERVISLKHDLYDFLDKILFRGKFECLEEYKDELNTEEKYTKIYLFLTKYLIREVGNFSSKYVNLAYNEMYSEYIKNPAVQAATWEEAPSPFSFERPKMHVCNKTFREEKAKLRKKYLGKKK